MSEKRQRLYEEVGTSSLILLDPFVAVGSDIFSLICTLLNPRDILALWKTTKHFRTLCNRLRESGVITKRVIDVLMHEMKWPTRLFQTLREQKGQVMISGSFLLQVIIGKRWAESDIDCYASRSQRFWSSPFAHECVRFSVADLSYTREGLESRLKKTFDNHYSGEFRGIRIRTNYRGDIHKLFDEIIDIPTAGYPIQWIQTRETHPSACLRHFDLDFLANWFDGSRLVIGNVSAVLNNETTFNYLEDPKRTRTENWLNQIGRCRKYIDRGFAISNCIVHSHAINIPMSGDNFQEREDEWSDAIMWERLGRSKPTITILEYRLEAYERRLFVVFSSDYFSLFPRDYRSGNEYMLDTHPPSVEEKTRLFAENMLHMRDIALGFSSSAARSLPKSFHPNIEGLFVSLGIRWFDHYILMERESEPMYENASYKSAEEVLANDLEVEFP